MDHLAELLATDRRRALEFFFVGLANISGSAVDRRELLYNASVLAHYAQVSTTSSQDLPTPRTLGDVLDNFVLNSSLPADPDLMENAAAQCLLLAGFFEDQMRRRHSIRWYAELGAGFFGRAAVHEPSEAKALLLDSMARHFETWRGRYARLGRDLRAQPYLLVLPPPPTD